MSEFNRSNTGVERPRACTSTTSTSSWCKSYCTTVHGSRNGSPRALKLVHVPEVQPPYSPALCLSPREVVRIEVRSRLPVGEHVVEYACVPDVLDLLGVICVRVFVFRETESEEIGGRSVARE